MLELAWPPNYNPRYRLLWVSNFWAPPFFAVIALVGGPVEDALRGLQ
jgi:hypothetical protein